MESLPGENWVPIAGYEGKYFVSSLGRVVGRGGHLKVPRSDREGYQFIGLFRNGKVRLVRLHRIVAAAFLGGLQDAPVNHIDGDKTNNAASNLEWSSPLLNIRHARDVLGKFPRGEKHHRSTLTQEQADEMRARYARGGITMRQVGNLFGVQASCAWNIIHGKRYRRTA